MPVRKIYYNLATTGLSVAAALLIGGIEVISILHDEAGLTDPVTTGIAGLDLENVGYLLVGLFVAHLGARRGVLAARPRRAALDRPDGPARRLSPRVCG